MGNQLTKKEALVLLNIPEKYFDNYSKFSKELIGTKLKGKWIFSKTAIEKWLKLKTERTIYLDRNEYEKCFEFAIKMAYGGLSLHGIRGERTEVQAADDVILGILAEYAIKKFLLSKYNLTINLDEGVHPKTITPQDIDSIEINGIKRKPKIGVGIKASKMKSSYLVLGAKEVELENRSSDLYIFARVGLPSDHLFRILRDHSFFKKVRKFLDVNSGFKKIEELGKIPIWICGYVFKSELEKVTEIPGQSFDSGYRYVKSVAKMHNSDEEWERFSKSI